MIDRRLSEPIQVDDKFFLSLKDWLVYELLKMRARRAKIDRLRTNGFTEEDLYELRDESRAAEARFNYVLQRYEMWK